jgi:hypothetical protein
MILNGIMVMSMIIIKDNYFNKLWLYKLIIERNNRVIDNKL